jgi:cytochrome P450
MASESTATQADAPPHVPAELIFDVDSYSAPNTRTDPFSVTEHIYEERPPVFYSPARVAGLYSGLWVVSRYEDIREVYQNDALYSNEGAANFQSLVGETFRMIPLAVDPPEHGKFRILLNPWFSPRAINEMEPKIRATISELVDGFVNKGEADLAYDFGRLYPVRVFLDLMGFPRDMLEEFLSWEYAILHSGGDPERVKWGIGSAIAYIRGFIEDLRRSPKNTLASHIVHGEIDGAPLAEDDVLGAVTFLWVGGLDTVAATTSLMFRRLALEPGLQEKLRADHERIPEAIEEFLRVQPLVNSTRVAKQDHEIRGVKIKRGDRVMCLNTAGNFDPDEFEDPREVRFDRPQNRHFTLAGGPHRCLGSHLARRELRIALEEVLQRLPTFRMKPGADLTAWPGLIAAPRLPVVWDVDGAA